MLDGTIPPEKHPYYLQLVSQESKRLSRLVTGMLNLSKIEAGELKPKMTEFDISELLFQTVLLFEQLVAKKGIELIGLEDLRPLRITGDRDMLLQVFYNLLDNAVKFTPPGQQIIFETTVAPEDSKHTDGGRFFGFSLRNTGVGIGSDQLPRIFDRFYKTDSSRSYDTQSSGLGLYLVKTLVQLHGGSIKADSDGTAYTEFSLLLPI
jgi:signal transduction histidine kinase